MKKVTKPYFTAANVKMKGKPEKQGLLSNKHIEKKQNQAFEFFKKMKK